jgi:hypothetical protein
MPDSDKVLNLLEQSKLSDLRLNTLGRAADVSKPGHSGLFEDFTHLDSATPAVFNPVKMIVLRTPGMYDSNPLFAKMLKSIMESHATSASGFDIEYTLDTDQTPIGHNGQNLEVPMATKLSQQSPSFTFPELTGGIIWKVFERWLKDIKDPVTGSSLLNMAGNADFVSTNYSMTMLFIQFDATHRPENIMNACLMTNMFPKGTGQFGMKFDLAQPTKQERSISFTGLQQHNDNVLSLARDIAETLTLTKLSGDKLNASMDSVSSMLAESGIASQAASALAD